ncbi:phage tail protein [Acinetobacter baumannii]|uniref:phage tail-collar fiber domain-containing protein n=1 Tax=Acinetobacter baumannii TaxID=470 RepID=UPI00244C902B|nr:phage tail protein [Acinetobacter baumannii]MDH2604197.1 phage tail protein [Acinetobacter baumannii]
MSSPYFNVTTNAGDAAIANAIATSTKLNITHVAFGDGNGSSPTPDKTRTTLVKEVYRQGVNKYEKHPTISNFIEVEAILPSIVGSFYIREIGLIIDGKTLISHGAVAPVFKEANSVREYRLRFTINIQDAEIVNVMLDDTLIYATQGWVNDNYVPRTDIIDNLTTDDSNKPLSAKQGLKLQQDKLAKSGGTVTGDLRVNGITYLNKIRNNSDFWFTDETEQYGQRILTGGLLVSSTFSQSNLVPVNGIYSQGDIRTSGKLVAAQLEGNAATASKLATARTVSFSGGATGSFNYDGSGNSSCLLTFANSGVAAGSYASTIQIPQISVNAAGQITAISQQNIRAATVNQSGVVQLTDDLQTDDSTKALTAKQGKGLQDNKLDKIATAVAAKKLEIETTSYTNDDDFIKYLADKPTSFFDNQMGKFFAQYSVGLVSSLKGGGTLIIGNDVVTGKTKIISCVLRDDGVIDYLNKKELAYTDSNISGNSATASKLQIARKINSINFDGTQDINIEAPLRLNGSISNLSQLDAATNDGKYTVAEVVIAGLYGYGVLVVLRSGGTCHQIYYPHLASGVNNGTMAMRQSWNTNGDIVTWSDWRVVGTRDDSKLPLIGGTVTGDLRINGITYLDKIRGNSDLWITDETEQYGRRVLTGGLLVSNTFSQSNLVPVNGIYSQGDIRTAGKIIASQLDGNAATASKFATVRTVSFSGGATGSFNYDGSSNSSCLLTLANSGVSAGSYASTIQIPQISVNAAGQITSISQQNIRAATVNQSGVVQLADDLVSDDSTKALTAKQGKGLQDNKLDKTATAVAAKKLEIETTSYTNDDDFIKYLADKPTSFFDNQTGKFFSQFSVGFVSSLKGGGTLIIGNDVVTGKTKIISCVLRDDGVIDYLNKKELAYTDSNISGNSATATKLQTARNIALSGAVSGSGSFDGSGNITINTISNNAIGIGQTWQDVKANRSLETTYLNSTGRPIQLCLTFPDTNSATMVIEAIVDGVSIFKHTYDAAGPNYGSGFYSFIVPAGSTYKIIASSAIQPLYWSELR